MDSFAFNYFSYLQLIKVHPTIMKKTISLFIFILLFLQVSSGQTEYEVVKDFYLKANPDSYSDNLMLIPAGVIVKKDISSDYPFIRITYNGEVGYVSINDLKVYSKPEEKVQQEVTPVKGTEPKPKQEPRTKAPKVNTVKTMPWLEKLWFFRYIFLAIIGIFLILKIWRILYRTAIEKAKLWEEEEVIEHKRLGRERKAELERDRQIKNEKENRDELVQSLNKNSKFIVTTSSSTSNYNDDSIIDVTDQSYRINSNSNLKKYSIGVPYWEHQYVYSYSEINSSSSEQKKFYAIFKNSFLNGEYLDLEGNTNYAFILLFDLLNEFDNHKDISKLESQLKILGQYYPKTKSYGISFLIQKMEANGDCDGVSRLRAEDVYSYQNYNTDYDYWGLGSKYKTKLNLNDEEVKLLNKLWYPSNNFCSVEYCCVEIIKLYNSVIEKLKASYIAEGTTIDAQFLVVADIIARKHFKYNKGSQNYKYCIETTTNEFYSHIFKHCENAVREYYGHKRKINTDTYYTTAEAKTEFETKIISKVSGLLPVLISKVSQPDEATDIELYSQNTNRWKIKFEELTTNYNYKPKEFIDSIVTLGKLNKKNPSIENIFFEASKFIAKYDKESALSLYVHYLYHDLKSATFDNKQLTKTIQKNLFKTNEQLHDFEKIISELIKDKDLEKALKNISKVYEVKRKKIQLDIASIKEVQQLHSGTVELLNEYLKDDFEDENNSIKSQEINNEEIKIEITQKSEDNVHTGFVSELSFSAMEISALELFSKSNFSVPQSELEVFAKSKGIFKNQLIVSINEACYNLLDDVLIEEEDDYYTINTNYFQRISVK
jgi:ribosomal protein L20A (L18A)